MTASTPTPSSRLLSLDAFRGATIAGMLLVNNPGSWSAIYPPLEHAPWHGWTPTDMIFPFFLWIVGVSLTLSFGRRMEQGADRGEMFGHVLKRSAIIFGLGLFLASFPFGLLPEHHFALARLRIPGVLQRIAVCYLVVGFLFLRTGPRGQVVWTTGLLLGYALLLKAVPVPGYGAGVLEPTGNLAWWIDSHVLAGHTWSGAPAPGFDPEGILSTLPAIATTLLGVLAGHCLRGSLSREAKVARLLLSGGVLLVAGYLCGLWLPINKNLWTSSYALFMAGWASVLFAAMFWLIDVRGWQRWATPFVMFGMNALGLFVLAGVLGRLLGLIKLTDGLGTAVSLKTWIYQGVFASLGEPRMASLLFALSFVALHLLVAWVLWRKRWFFRA